MDNVVGLDKLDPITQQLLMSYEKRIRHLEERVSDQNYDLTGFVDSAFKRRDRREMHRTTEFSVYKAWCIDTLDPRKQGRVRYFSPYLHEADTPTDACPFAEPISWCGGFDDCGVTWIPPAGSTLIIIFEAGSAHIAFYLGTMWPRDRGPKGHQYWFDLIKEGIPEYQRIHEGHRTGYFHGPKDHVNDEQQVLPQWNTENYEQYDWDGVTPDRDKRPDDVAYPHIYGFKTPQKHMLKFVDGNYQCHHRWKRLEIMSSLGNWMIFKDDFLHEGGQWVNPESGIPCGSDHANCVNDKGEPIEKKPAWPPCGDAQMGEGRNKYFKHKNECRPYVGVGTPQNTRCSLPQSGIQVLSRSGSTIIMDDSVEQPQGIPSWEKILEPFDFGCTNICLCKTIFKSATGHRIEMNDEEKEENIRGRKKPIEHPCDQTNDPWDRNILDRSGPARNGILLLTATGNRIEMNDETDSGGTAGINRGIALQSTCNHVIEMVDHLNKQQSPPRMAGGAPTPDSTHAWIRIRSGYGLCMEFRDWYSQKETQEQYIQIMAPQYDACKGCGPHIIRLQEKKECGYIFVRAAGDFYRITAGNEVIVVGNHEKCLGPKTYFRYATKDNVIASDRYYYNYAYDTHIFWAKTGYIILAVRQDCPPVPPEEEWGPCLYQVATSKCAVPCPLFRGLIALKPKSFSPYVFASNTGPDDPCG